jgi:hypothetical protein
MHKKWSKRIDQVMHKKWSKRIELLTTKQMWSEVLLTSFVASMCCTAEAFTTSTVSTHYFPGDVMQGTVFAEKNMYCGGGMSKFGHFERKDHIEWKFLNSKGRSRYSNLETAMKVIDSDTKALPKPVTGKRRHVID